MRSGVFYTGVPVWQSQTVHPKITCGGAGIIMYSTIILVCTATYLAVCMVKIYG